LLGSITGINTIDLTGLILKLSDDTKTCEATMDECLSDWMADSIGNLYTGSLLDSNFKQITDNDYDVYLGPGEYYALIDYSEGVDVKVPISIRVPDETPVLTKTGPDRYEATCELLRNLYTMPIKLLPLLLNIKKYSKKDPGCYTQSLSFLGICINYPNGLFNFSSFQI